MADKMTEQQRHRCMSHIRGKDTVPEVIVRKELFRRGFRFRKNVRSLPGTPDIVLPKYRTAVFVNGCFWHGHEHCRYYTVPKSNSTFWIEKVKRNKERDALDIQNLESLSWSVITIWECQLKKTGIDMTMERVVSELEANRKKWDGYRAKRRQDRAFAVEQARRHRAILSRLEAQIDEQFHIPAKIRKMSKKEI